MSFLIAVGSLIVVLGVLVFVHELGHFLAAKAVGIRVHRFALGMGQPIPGLAFRRGDTEYAICWLPIGGYVKMASREEGANSSALEGSGPVGASPVRAEEYFEAQPVWQRMIVILAGVTMNVLFAWLVFSWLAARQGEQIDPVTVVGGVDVEQLPPGAEEMARLRPGDRIVAVGGQPVVYWDDVSGALVSAPADSFTVELEGGGAILLKVPHAAGGDRKRLADAIGAAHPAFIQYLESHGAAARAGVQAGDTLLAIDDEPVTFQPAVVRRIRASAGAPLHFRLGRAGGRVDLTVTPDSVSQDGSYIGRVGIQFSPAVAWESRPWRGLEAWTAGWRLTTHASTQILRTVQGLLSSRVSSREVGGPILIAQLAGQAARFGLDSFLGLLALISVNLAVLNLLPIPVLDGGQFLFLLGEAGLRRPLPLRLREALTMAGLALIVMLMLLAFWNDLARNWDAILGFFQRLFRHGSTG